MSAAPQSPVDNFSLAAQGVAKTFFDFSGRHAGARAGAGPNPAAGGRRRRAKLAGLQVRYLQEYAELMRSALGRPAAESSSERAGPPFSSPSGGAILVRLPAAQLPHQCQVHGGLVERSTRSLVRSDEDSAAGPPSAERISSAYSCRYAPEGLRAWRRRLRRLRRDLTGPGPGPACRPENRRNLRNSLCRQGKIVNRGLRRRRHQVFGSRPVMVVKRGAILAPHMDKVKHQVTRFWGQEAVIVSCLCRRGGAIGTTTVTFTGTRRTAVYPSVGRSMSRSTARLSRYASAGRDRSSN